MRMYLQVTGEKLREVFIFVTLLYMCYQQQLECPS